LATLQDILKDTADYLSWQLEEGETTAEVSRAVLDELVPQVQLSTVKEPAGESQPAATITETGVVDISPQRASQPPIPVVPKAVKQPVPANDPLTGDSPAEELAAIARTVSACTLCPLHAERTQAVPGQGHPQPEILFVGEAPGADEDEQGLAFVGRAGQLLTKMIEAMGYTREEVFIANVNKCRPPGNRKPLREEMDACLPYLRLQVAILRPKVIVALGATAVEGLVPETATQKISALRGKWLSFEGIPLMPTYHPAYLLRSPAMKKPVWEDLKTVLHHLGHPVPPRSANH